MAKLPADWDAPRRRSAPPPPEVQAIQAMRNSGYGFGDVKIIWDGRIHRVHMEDDKRNEKSGWYVFHSDNVPAGEFGNWRLGASQKWHAELGRPLSAEEEYLIQQQYEKIRATREADEKKRHENAAKACQSIWNEAAEAPDDHPYFIKKGVKNHGLRVTGDGRLILPIYIAPDQLSSVQFIGADGSKRFQTGGDINGGMFIINRTSESKDDSVYIVEGYATGASVHEATGARVVIALNAGNLSKVAEKIVPALTRERIVIVADNDDSGVGQKSASEAAKLIGAECIIPPAPEGQSADANDFAQAGGDLHELLRQKEEKPWLEHVDDFSRKPEPIKWFIKGHVQQHATQMIFGPSGSGKTFYSLDMALTIACDEMENWHGLTVKHAPVVYLAGEGFIGMKARVAGWKAYHGIKEGSTHLYISKSAIDLNPQDDSPANSAADRVIREIEKLNIVPGLINVDTVHRFFSGDENTAKDTKTFLTACSKISEHFNNCTIALIHHTGVAADAKNRARGSSAWRGAMDLETMVSKNPDDPYMLITQTKNKDAELEPPLWLKQVKTKVPGWENEDGTDVETVVLVQENPAKDSDDYEGNSGKGISEALHTAFYEFIEAASNVGSLNDNGEFDGLALEEWRHYFYSHSAADNPESKRRAFNRAREALIKKGRLSVEDDVYRVAGELRGDYEEIISKRLAGQRDRAGQCGTK